MVVKVLPIHTTLQQIHQVQVAQMLTYHRT
jgi:hypothetical protein